MNYTEEQTSFLEAVSKGENVFLTGGAGTGKTFILKEAVRMLQERGKKVIVCAATGTAAQHCEGTTLHRAFGFRYSSAIDAEHMTLNMNVTDALCEADTVIIDEISMVRMDLFDAAALSVRGAELKTGRHIQLITAGDFCQLPPVINEKRGDLEILRRYYNRPISRAFAFQADHWNDFDFRYIVLHEVQRQKDREFAGHLLRLSMGDIGALAYFVRNSSPVLMQEGIYLYARKDQADIMNRQRIDSLPGRAHVYTAIIKGNCSEADRVVPDILKLKTGAKIVTVLNDPGGAYYNGSVGTVVKMLEKSIIVKMDTGSENVKIEYYTWHIFEYKAAENGGFVKDDAGTVSQLPVRLAYAMTIHRAQGFSFDNVNLDPYCWVSGQLYTALSRIRTVQGLYLLRHLDSEYLVTDDEAVRFMKMAEQRGKMTLSGSSLSLTAKSAKNTGRPLQYGMNTIAVRVPEPLKETIRQVCKEWAEDPDRRKIVCITK